MEKDGKRPIGGDCTETQVRRGERSVRQHGQPSRTSQVAAVPVLIKYGHYAEPR